MKELSAFPGRGFQGCSIAMTKRIFLLFLRSVTEIFRVLLTESYRLWGVGGGSMLHTLH